MRSLRPTSLLSRDGFRASKRGPAEITLALEVTETSLAHDRETKLPLYAGTGIPEAWLVDLTTDAIEVSSEPGPGGYGKLVCIRRGERVVSAALPGLASMRRRHYLLRVRRAL